jgi:hypothetical protein
MAAAATHPFSGRSNTLIFRGAKLGRARSTLMSALDDINHNLAGTEITLDIKMDIGPQDYISIPDLSAYKYLLYADGWAQSSRLKYFLFCQSTLIGHDWLYREYFTPFFRANEDFYAVRVSKERGKFIYHWEDLPGLLSQVAQVPEVELTAKAARNSKVARWLFSPEVQKCVIYRSLLGYLKLLRFSGIIPQPGYITFAEYIQRDGS